MLTRALTASFAVSLALSVSLSASASPGMTREWDALYGGIGRPNSQMLQGEVGFSGAPKLGYHFVLGEGFSIGPGFAFDYAYYTASAGGSLPALHFTAPTRVRIHRDRSISVGLRLEPGLTVEFAGGVGVGLLLNGGVNCGWIIDDRFIIGGGIDLLLGFRFAPDFQFRLPILLGPVAEFHPTRDLAVTMDLKFGPAIFGPGGVTFGLKTMAGVSYRL